MTKCKYCGHRTRKVHTDIHTKDGDEDYYIICNKCKNVLHRPPSHIPHEQHEKYLGRIIEKDANDNTQ
jgi:hypothetical protein